MSEFEKGIVFFLVLLIACALYLIKNEIHLAILAYKIKKKEEEISLIQQELRKLEETKKQLKEESS